jgi:hypothetical protein
MTTLRRIYVIVAITLAVALIAGAAYWRQRNACIEPGSGIRGETKIQADGTQLYFDGQCWTARPLPPLDMPL